MMSATGSSLSTGTLVWSSSIRQLQDRRSVLLDFAPEFLQEERQRIVLTTRNTHEIEGVISPMLRSYDIVLRPGDEVMVLEGLRSLSGRLALRLEGSFSPREGGCGTLFARWIMEEIGAREPHRALA